MDRTDPAADLSISEVKCRRRGGCRVTKYPIADTGESGESSSREIDRIHTVVYLISVSSKFSIFLAFSFNEIS